MLQTVPVYVGRIYQQLILVEMENTFHSLTHFASKSTIPSAAPGLDIPVPEHKSLHSGKETLNEMIFRDISPGLVRLFAFLQFLQFPLELISMLNLKDVW